MAEQVALGGGHLAKVVGSGVELLRQVHAARIADRESVVADRLGIRLVPHNGGLRRIEHLQLRSRNQHGQARLGVHLDELDARSDVRVVGEEVVHLLVLAGRERERLYGIVIRLRPRLDHQVVIVGQRAVLIVRSRVVGRVRYAVLIGYDSGIGRGSVAHRVGSVAVIHEVLGGVDAELDPRQGYRVGLVALGDVIAYLRAYLDDEALRGLHLVVDGLLGGRLHNLAVLADLEAPYFVGEQVALRRDGFAQLVGAVGQKVARGLRHAVGAGGDGGHVLAWLVYDPVHQHRISGNALDGENGPFDAGGSLRYGRLALMVELRRLDAAADHLVVYRLLGGSLDDHAVLADLEAPYFVGEQVALRRDGFAQLVGAVGQKVARGLRHAVGAGGDGGHVLARLVCDASDHDGVL